MAGHEGARNSSWLGDLVRLPFQLVRGGFWFQQGVAIGPDGAGSRPTPLPTLDDSPVVNRHGKRTLGSSDANGYACENDSSTPAKKVKIEAARKRLREPDTVHQESPQPRNKKVKFVDLTLDDDSSSLSSLSSDQSDEDDDNTSTVVDSPSSLLESTIYKRPLPPDPPPTATLLKMTLKNRASRSVERPPAETDYTTDQDDFEDWRQSDGDLADDRLGVLVGPEDFSLAFIPSVIRGRSLAQLQDHTTPWHGIDVYLRHQPRNGQSEE